MARVDAFCQPEGGWQRSGAGVFAMLIVNPARCEDRMVYRTQALADAIGALGTTGFGMAAFRVFEDAFDVDHWAIFRYGMADPVKCIATASRNHEAAAGRNVDLFLTRCHRVDPSLIAFRQQQSARPCLVRMGISDIDDVQYRHCFYTANVQERVSFFLADGAELLQLCIYRRRAIRAFSDSEMRMFAAISGLIANAAVKHEALCERTAGTPGRLDPGVLERRLQALDARLSRRECEVCVLAILGKTVDATARDLRIRRTSVITYRQRAYQKLGIARLSDLVVLVCEAAPAPVNRLNG
jgi:DNA-binding CsgD family transcriptional regulator